MKREINHLLHLLGLRRVDRRPPQRWFEELHLEPPSQHVAVQFSYLQELPPLQVELQPTVVSLGVRQRLVLELYWLRLLNHLEPNPKVLLILLPHSPQIPPDAVLLLENDVLALCFIVHPIVFRVCCSERDDKVFSEILPVLRPQLEWIVNRSIE